METIKDVAKNLMQTWKEKNRESLKDNPEILLKEILSSRELTHIKFDYFRKGIVGISVDSSSWLYYFSLQKEVLLAKLYKQSPRIKDIRFCIGETKCPGK